MLYLLDFGIKCNLTEALLLQKALLEYCMRRAIYWEPSTFASDDTEAMISSMELKFTEKLAEIINTL